MPKKHLIRFNTNRFRGNLSQHNKGHYDKHTAKIILGQENFQLTALPVRSKTKQGCQSTLWVD